MTTDRLITAKQHGQGVLMALEPLLDTPGIRILTSPGASKVWVSIKTEAWCVESLGLFDSVVVSPLYRGKTQGSYRLQSADFRRMLQQTLTETA